MGEEKKTRIGVRILLYMERNTPGTYVNRSSATWGLDVGRHHVHVLQCCFGVPGYVFFDMWFDCVDDSVETFGFDGLGEDEGHSMAGWEGELS